MGLAISEGVRARRAEGALEDERGRSLEQERVGVASLVSAWVEVEYVPDASSTHYLRRSKVIVANESNEPVFDVHVIIGVGDPLVQVGPLAVPTPIPVLPPRRHREWDISSGLSALDSGVGAVPDEPAARIDFDDSRAVRWRRNFDGKLIEMTQLVVDPPLTEEEGTRQIGDLTNWLNPMGVAISFLNVLRQDGSPPTLRDLQPFLAEGAPSWKATTPDLIELLRNDLADYGLAAHTWYRTPQIAYVRLIPSEAERLRETPTGYYTAGGRYLTLVFYAGQGWFVFSVGGMVTTPEWIGFPKGAISPDPRVNSVKNRRN
ncbi:hypothetical protein [Arthrobacter sp. NPDC092385]|uniref:hypothetical protein n=1 Tax=Arthrobacter sp. NPDC092385 TaxID=3363943 RepID=UPI0037FDCE87